MPGAPLPQRPLGDSPARPPVDVPQRRASGEPDEGDPSPSPERAPGRGVGAARRMAAMAAVAGLVLAIDQLTKSLAERDLANGPVHVVGSLSFTLTYNKGAAFSFAQGLTGWLIVVGIVLVLVLLLASRRLPSYPAAVAVGLMLGGAMGNLSDRLFRGNHGAVVDFIASRYWPTFNLADVAIVTGAILLVVVGYRRDPRRHRPSSRHRDEREASERQWTAEADRPTSSS